MGRWGAEFDPDRLAALEAPTGRGRAYWPEVARLLRASYRSLHEALAEA
ncbi:MAG TPA: hypothetical protein VID95_04945 [Candidatus Limnocylindrales bacterium]|jgi:hypothetical protein